MKLTGFKFLGNFLYGSLQFGQEPLVRQLEDILFAGPLKSVLLRVKVVVLGVLQ